MKIKNEILEQSDSPERMSSLTLSFRLCLLFVSVCILIPLGHAEDLSEDIDPLTLLEDALEQTSQNISISDITENSNAPFYIWQPPIQLDLFPSSQWQTWTNSNIAVNFAAKVEKKPSHLLIAKNPTTDISRQLWRARITNLKDGKISESQKELRQIIRQINSVEFETQYQTSEPLIVLEPVQKAEPNAISSDTETPKQQKPNKIKSQLLDGQIIDQTLQTFKNLSQHPDQLHNPFELAEILFNSHCFREAAKCYQEALNRMTTNQTDQRANKAWVLFQIGNCLQDIDRPAAIKMYKQLIEEHPNSPWTDLAKARSKLIDWYQQDKPWELVAEKRF